METWTDSVSVTLETFFYNEQRTTEKFYDYITNNNNVVDQIVSYNQMEAVEYTLEGGIKLKAERPTASVLGFTELLGTPTQRVSV